MESIATMGAGWLQQKQSTRLASFVRNRVSILDSEGKHTASITENHPD